MSYLSSDPAGPLQEVEGWLQGDLQLGHVAGVALDSQGSLLLLHRGAHKWDDRFVLTQKNENA